MLSTRRRDDTHKVKSPPFGLILLLGAFASLTAMVLESMPASAANPRLALSQPSASFAVPSAINAVVEPSVTTQSPAVEPRGAVPSALEQDALSAAPASEQPAPTPAASVLTVTDGVDRSQPGQLAGIPAFESDLLALLNAARVGEGIGDLVRDAELDGVALARARNLVQLGYFDHYAPDGTSAFSELAARALPYYLAGENLARNNYPPNQTVVAAYEGLMASPGHRANILEPRFGAIGVAAVRDGDVWLYVTVFTNPR